MVDYSPSPIRLNPMIFDEQGNITPSGEGYLRAYLEARLPELERTLAELRDSRRVTRAVLDLEFTI